MITIMAHITKIMMLKKKRPINPRGIPFSRQQKSTSTQLELELKVQIQRSLLASNVMVMESSQIIFVVKYSMIMDAFPDTFALYI
jgi:hypothetical protein